MAQSTISIRVDSSIKEKFDSLCDAFGLSASAAFNIFMKTVIRERRIPFEIRADVEESQKMSALSAFNALRKAAEKKGLTDITLDDINAEIKCVRDERKERSLSRH